MAQRRRTSGVALTALFSAALLAGCTAQDEPPAEDPPPTSSTTETSTPLGDPVTDTYTGTHTIQLGAPPPEATHIYLDITCLSAGTLVLPSGFEVTCAGPDKAGTRAYSSMPLSPGQDSVEIATSDPDVTYEVKAVYENGASVR